MNTKRKRTMDLHILPLSAGISGIVEALSSHWIDRIKTEVQKQSLMNKKISIFGSINSIYKNGGIVNFYSGIGPRLVGIIPMRFAYWTTVVKMNDVIEPYHHTIRPIVAGFVVGCVQTLLDNPIEVLKIRLMTKNHSDKLDIGFNVNGIKKLYAGFVPCLYRNCVFAMCVCGFTREYGNQNKFLAAGFGGFVGAIITQPFDVVKTEFQRYQKIADDKSKQKRGMFRFLYNEIKENPSKLWAGGAIRCTLGFINMGIGFYALDHIQKFFYQYV